MINYHEALSTPPGLVPPDLYFSSAYGAVDAAEVGGTWGLLEMFDGAWQMPIVVRPVDGGLNDASSPYGYSGVYASPALTEADTSKAWTEAIAAMQDRGIISAFLRHSPLVGQAPRHPRQVSVVEDHPTVAVDLESDEGMWASMEGRSRTAVRKAMKAGFMSVVRPAVAEDIRSGSPFRLLYEATMSRRGASPSYTFSNEYYARLHEALPEDLLIAEVLSSVGIVESSALLMRHGRFLHYHLSGSRPEAARLGVNNLMLWEALRHARDIGVTRFHLGGGLNGRDPLFTFKKGFGGRTLTFAATGLVVNDVAYADLVSRMRRRQGKDSAPPESESRFFPAYRAGV